MTDRQATAAFVTFPEMVAYVDGRLAGALEVIARIERELDAHNRYHRETLERMVAEAKGAWPKVVTIGAALVSAVAAVLAAYAALHGHATVVTIRHP